MARKLIVEIVGDASSLERTYKKAGVATQTFGSKLSGLGRAAAFTASGAALGGLTVAAHRGFEEIKSGQLVTAQTAAVLKSTGGSARVTAKHIAALASSLSKMSGVDDEVVQSGENILLTFTNIRNKLGRGNNIFDQATRSALDMSVAMGEDLQTASIQVGKALNDPIRGIGALRRVGVTFTKAQEKQIKTLEKTGHHLKAQKIIIRELNKEFGGSAKAAGETLPGQLNKLSNAFDEFSAKGLKVVFDELRDLAPAFKTFVGVIKDLLPVLRPLAKLILDIFVTPMKVIAALIRGDWTAAWKAFSKPVRDAIEVVKGLVKILGRVLGDIVGRVKAQAVALGGAIKDGIVNGIKGLDSGIWDAIRAAVRFVVGKVKAGGSAIAGLGSAVSEGILDGLKGFAAKLIRLIIDPINFVIRKINAISGLVHIPKIPEIPVPGSGGAGQSLPPGVAGPVGHAGRPPRTTPPGLQGPAGRGTSAVIPVTAVGGVVINGDIHLPGVRNSQEFIRELQKEARRTSPSRAGRFGGHNLGLT